MKRFFTLLAVGLFLANSGVFAEKHALIDFSQLAGTADANDKTVVLDEATTIDYADQAGASFTQAETTKLKTSLAITSWEIQLASSAQTTTNQSMTEVKVAYVSPKSVSQVVPPTTNGNPTAVLGARIHFPDFAINSFAVIKPAFTIPAYATKKGNEDNADLKGNQFVGYGVLKNVGTIRDMQLTVLGRNFPNTISIILENQNGEEQEIQFGSLKFDGWKQLTWHNPDYQTEVRNREINTIPLYPRSVPFIKLKGIKIHRDGANDGGDFVTYIKDISVIYDVALVDRQTDIDDEALWNITKQREANARLSEIKTLGAQQVLRVLEQKKLATEPDFKAPDTPAPKP
jgi:hypothetical protein